MAKRRLRVTQILAAACTLVGCIEPHDRTPGTWLSGTPTALPSDWGFTDDYQQIAIQVHTPYGLAHSVTIWCASMDGRLHLGARDPESKNWPGWVDRNPDVRLGIDGRLYDVRLAPLEDPEHVARLQRVYAAKYDLPSPGSGEAPPTRYWIVEAREG